MTPYADLEPVFLAGSTISKATLHNAQEVARKDIRDGDYVLIEKAGDVIPKVVKSMPQRRPTGADEPQPWVMPTTCPICGTTLVPRRGGSRLALREHELPGPAAPQPRALRLAAGDEHRRASASRWSTRS